MEKIFATIIFIFIAAGCEDNAAARENGHHKTPVTTAKILKTDREILDNLAQSYGLIAKDMGGDGACLFHSMREQISQAELIKALKISWPLTLRNQVKRYATLPNSDQADVLRQISIEEEKEFLNTSRLANIFAVNNAADQQWILEMAKDWRQEVGSLNAHDTRKWFNEKSVSSTGKEELWDYVKNHRNQYWAKTSCKTNWAGSAEAIAIARLLNRPLKMFGQDYATSEEGALVNNGVVTPYLSYNDASFETPILVFQTNGGGHYQMLTKGT